MALRYDYINISRHFEWTNMKFKFRFIIVNLIFLIITSSSFAIERYKSTEETLTDPHRDVKCQCDANKDPCCIPPTGTSSRAVDERPDKTTDVAKCLCDPKTDPCCKKVEGTERKNNHGKENNQNKK